MIAVSSDGRPPWAKSCRQQVKVEKTAMTHRGDEDYNTTYMPILDRRGVARERMGLAKMTDLSERKE